jgi:hypothetical protein
LTGSRVTRLVLHGTWRVAPGRSVEKVDFSRMGRAIPPPSRGVRVPCSANVRSPIGRKIPQMPMTSLGWREGRDARTRRIRSD